MRYEAPESLEGAVALLAGARGDARVLAGGTDLLVQMRADVLEPELIVDIKRIPETRAVTEEKGGWRIGAAVTGAELKEHPRLKQVWPGVIEAANLIGSTQVQGRATMGGNLCNGSPAADSVPALIAAGAVASLVGPQGPARPAGRGRDARPPQARPGEGRDRRLVPAAAAGGALERRLPALHSANGDGHRGGGRGSEPDRGWCRYRHRRPCLAGRGGRAGAAGARGGPGHRGQPARRARPAAARSRGAGGLPSDRRQAGDHRIPDPGRGRCWRVARP